MPENVTCYPQRDVSGLITGIRLFLKQIKEKHPLPYPQEEWYYLTVTVPDVLDAYESTLKREAEKDAEIARLKIKLSRPESDYLLEKIIRLTAERDAEKRRADAACHRSCNTCKYHGLDFAESRHTDTPHQRVCCNLPKNHLYACIAKDQWEYASPEEIKAINGDVPTGDGNTQGGSK